MRHTATTTKPMANIAQQTFTPMGLPLRPANKRKALPMIMPDTTQPMACSMERTAGWSCKPW